MNKEKEPSRVTELGESSTSDKEEANKLRAQKALNTSNVLSFIAAMVLFLGFLFLWLPITLGGHILPEPIIFSIAGVASILLVVSAVIEVVVARSRAGTGLVVAGLALGIAAVTFMIVALPALPHDWQTPVYHLTLLLYIPIGFIVTLMGWGKAHQALQKTAEGYTARRSDRFLVEVPSRFQVRNYHLILAAGIIGSILLYLSAIIIESYLYALLGLAYLVITVMLAASVKIHFTKKHQ